MRNVSHNYQMRVQSDMQLNQGWIVGVQQVPSPYFNERPNNETPSLLVIHNISLPPGQYGGPYIDHLFTGKLNPNVHPYFATIYRLQVSAHCLIRRDGSLVQYVSFDKRAWHAGVSSFNGREACNDFSIGIELEGNDFNPFTQQQYFTLQKVSQLVIKHYAIPLTNIVGHSDIAPVRKTDPGHCFDWNYYRSLL